MGRRRRTDDKRPIHPAQRRITSYRGLGAAEEREQVAETPSVGAPLDPPVITRPVAPHEHHRVDRRPAAAQYPDPTEQPLPEAPDPPLALDMRAEGITSVVWCTGFGPDTGWVHVPVLRADGLPVHHRGITASPRMYVAGYPWLSTRGSGILYGVAADAARIAQHIAATAKGERAWTQHQPLCTLR
jgi:hypothetical protein